VRLVDLLLDAAAKLLVIIFIIHAAIYSYKIAEWSCARSVQWLTAGFLYVLAWRVFFSVVQIFESPVQEFVGVHQSYFIIPAYAMWAWGLYLLYDTLKNLGRTKK
jgi:hypothetical protein